MKYPKVIVVPKPYGDSKQGFCDTFLFAFIQPEQKIDNVVYALKSPQYNNFRGYTLGLNTLINTLQGKPICINGLEGTLND